MASHGKVAPAGSDSEAAGAPPAGSPAAPPRGRVGSVLAGAPLSPPPPRLRSQSEGGDAGTRPAIGWLGRGERWCGARSPPGCEPWAVVKATVRDVGRQAGQPPADWLGDRTILPYWRPPRRPRSVRQRGSFRPRLRWLETAGWAGLVSSIEIRR